MSSYQEWATSKDSTSIFGRCAERQQLVDWLTSQSSTLLLTGPAGIGKTFLAEAFANLIVANGQSVEILDANVFHHRSEGIDSQATFLILDGLSNIVREALEKRLSLWKSQRKKVLLITRQQNFMVADEVLKLAPLSVKESAQLFVFAAYKFGARPSIDAEDPTVKQLMEALDGLPLAIVLAAQRLIVLTPKAMLSRQHSRLDWLKHGTISLRAKIESAWNELPKNSQDLLQSCALLGADFSLETIEFVHQAPDGQQDIIDSVAELEASSWIQSASAETSLITPRFRMLSVYRDFVVEFSTSLAADHPYQLRKKQFYTNFSLKHAALSRTHQAADSILAILMERSNLEHEFEAFLEHDPIYAASLTIALDVIVVAQGGVDAQLERHTRLIERLKKAPTDMWLPRILLARSNMYFVLSKNSLAYRDAMDAMKIATELDSIELQTEARSMVAIMASLEGNFSFDTDVLLDNPSSTLDDISLRCLGIISIGRGELEGAEQALFRARKACQQIKDHKNECIVMALLGLTYFELSNTPEARILFTQAIERATSNGYRWIEAGVTLWLAELELDENHMAEAALLFTQARTALTDMGDHIFAAGALGYSGIFAHMQGKLTEAKSLLEHALEMTSRERDFYREAIFRPHLAAVIAAQGDIHGATALFERSKQHIQTAQNPNLPAVLSILTSMQTIEQASQALRKGQHVEAERMVAGIRHHLFELGYPDGDPSNVPQLASLAQRSSDVRFASRLIFPYLLDAEAMLSANQGLLHPPPSSRVPQSVSPREAILRVGKEARWIETPNRERFDFARRKSLRYVLLCLLHARCDQPGTGVKTTRLIEVGWPGEKLVGDSGSHRVHMAIATLRKMGLQPLLQTHDDGYLLLPTWQVQWCD